MINVAFSKILSPHVMVCSTPASIIISLTVIVIESTASQPLNVFTSTIYLVVCIGKTIGLYIVLSEILFGGVQL